MNSSNQYFRFASKTGIISALLSSENQIKDESDLKDFYNDKRSKSEYIMGIFPFDSTVSFLLYTPKEINFIPYQKTSSLMDIKFSQVPKVQFIESIPSEKEFIEKVAQLVQEIEQNHLEKIVLSRRLKIKLSLSDLIHADELFDHLIQSNPLGYTFYIPLDLVKPRVFLGISPELLIRKKGFYIESNPLAGSIARGDSIAADEANAHQLFYSSKDLHEHQFVVRSIVERLRPLCRELTVPPRPSLVKTPTMWHLSTHIQGMLKDATISSLTLAKLLHPTPAICGWPQERAKALIKTMEPYDRGYYTGFVGWSDHHGDGEWAISLRCADIGEQTTYLYAGAGIVQGSKPIKELDETKNKIRSLLSLLMNNQYIPSSLHLSEM